VNSLRTRYYRDKKNGKFLGVCAGIADYTGVDTLWVRLGAVLLTLMGFGAITIPAYFLIGFFADKKPDGLYVDREEQRFWQGVRQSPRRSAREVRNKLRDIDRRMADVETYYVSGNAKLADEIERLR
jgi:phage shock protein C